MLQQENHCKHRKDALMLLLALEPTSQVYCRPDFVPRPWQVSHLMFRASDNFLHTHVKVLDLLFFTSSEHTNINCCLSSYCSSISFDEMKCAPCASVVHLLQADLEPVHHILAAPLSSLPPSATACEHVEYVLHASRARAAAPLLYCLLSILQGPMPGVSDLPRKKS